MDIIQRAILEKVLEEVQGKESRKTIDKRKLLALAAVAAAGVAISPLIEKANANQGDYFFLGEENSGDGYTTGLTSKVNSVIMLAPYPAALRINNSGDNVEGLPPFANHDFEVLLSSSIVIVSENGGSVDLSVTLKATKLNTSEVLVLEAHSNISGYIADFKPTSVTLQPGDSTSVELTVIVPSGVPKDTYPMSIVARVKTTQGGSWLLIVVGSSLKVPPP